MKMTRVTSSAILAIGHNPQTLQMKITFKTGNTYTYCRVPQELFTSFLKASSKGIYYANRIKGRYLCS